MKWFFGIVVFLVVGWKAAVYFINRADAVPQNTTARTTVAGTSPSSTQRDSVKSGFSKDTIVKNNLALPTGSIDTKSASPQAVVAFAKTLVGVPYLYGSTDPVKGFDCSGFITHVFNKFNIQVPRSSIDFTLVGKEVSAAEAREGDLILFTGTDSADRFVGHMGIVVSNTDTLRFIHSTSGRQYGVTITPFSNYYKGRYVKTVRIFPG